MDEWAKPIGIALVVGVIGPLFWLGVNVFENWLKRSWSRIRPRLRRRHSEQSRTTDGGLLK